MFSRFRQQYATRRDALGTGIPWLPTEPTNSAGYTEFATEFAGASFAGGLCRFHDADSGTAAQSWIQEAFPQFAHRVTPFGYDWLGRQFALDSHRIQDGEAQVLVLEPGTGEVLEIPTSFSGFHDDELINYADAALAIKFFEAWAAGNPGNWRLGQSQCVGYRIPLFLGGKDDLGNLEVSDLEVYWMLAGQLIQQTRGLPPASQISGVSIQ